MKILAHDPRFTFEGREGSFDDAVVIREVWCENTYEVFDGDLNNTGIVVDLGANIGSFSLYAAMLGAKKVIAVEPEPHNVDLLKTNVENNRHNVPDCEIIVEKNGVAGKEGLGFITNQEGSSRVVNAKAGKDLHQIRLMTLNDLFKKHQLEYIDVLKIDIEGLEGEVILAASEWTLNMCRFITIEYDQHANNLGAIVEKLSKTHQIKYVGKQGGMLFAHRY